jgi:hypothetical protein
MEMAALEKLPNYVVGRAAVPDLGARPFGDETVSAGCHATGGGPFPLADIHTGVQDQRSRDLAAICEYSKIK